MNDEQLLRYSRQIMLPGVDLDGQMSLGSAHVVVVGAGGLGNPVALYLAAAGVGQITIIDDDTIELSNISRQIAFADEDVGQSKAVVLARELVKRNPQVKVDVKPIRLNADNAASLLAECDVVIDCSDNYAARFVINDASLAFGTPVVFGAATAWQGQVFVADPRVPSMPCYECFNPSRDELDASCARNGVLGPLVGVIASQQAVEAMRLLLGMTAAPVLQVFDAKESQWHRITIKPREGCTCQVSGALSKG